MLRGFEMGFSQYENYRTEENLWIEQIPKHWVIKKLKFVSNYLVSNVDKKTYDDQETVRLVNYTDVYYNEFIHPDLDLMKSTASDAEIEKFKLLEGDVIITKDSESADDIGIPALVVKTNADLVCGYHLSIIRAKDDETVGSYLYRCFQSRFLANQLEVIANGVTRYGLPQAGTKSIFLPIPPLNEQQAIADFLDKEITRIDTLIEKKRQLIERLKEKRLAVITRAVTKGINPNAVLKPSGIEWLGDIPAHWEVKKLKYVLKKIYGGGTPNTENSEYWGGDLPWISPKDMKVKKDISFAIDSITEIAISESATKLLPECCVLMVVRSGILKHSLPLAINSAPVTLNQDMKGLLPFDEISPEFLFWYLQGTSDVILSQCSKLGATVDSIDMLELLRFPILFPDYAEQREIVIQIEGEIETIDELVEKTNLQVSKLNEYKTSLISSAVTGKIKVVVEG